MKITHPSGESYDLFPETQIELTRFNPFFNDLGEQSVPITIPATSKNLKLLNYPNRGDGSDKITRRLNVQLQEGAFSIVGRQAILSASSKDNIETSFYLNEGAFYEKIKDVSLKEIFEGKSIVFSSMDQTIDFMRSLITASDHRFACFQVATDNYILNEMKFSTTLNKYDFKKNVDTIEIIDGNKINVPRGFYITPFPKFKHVLQEVLLYFGYTLNPSFLDDEPFSTMSLLNDNIDTIVNNRIDYVDIIPNIMVSSFFDLIRKFNMEIVPDEIHKTVDIIHFDEQINQPISVDLSNNITSPLRFDYTDEYKQVKLSSEILPAPKEVHGFSSLFGDPWVLYPYQIQERLPISMLAVNFPTAYIRPADGSIVRQGVFGDKITYEVVGYLSNSYYDGGVITADDKTFPDIIPDVITYWITYPYVGPGRALHSTIIMSDESEEQSSNAGELKPMLCFSYYDNYYTYNIGTLSNYDWTGLRLWDYSLFYNGADGIFERFWRSRDTLMRNALVNMNADLQLSEDQKLSLTTLRRVLVDNQPYLISELKYVPGLKDPQNCSFLTTNLQKPISNARTESDYFPDRPYEWELKTQRSNTTAKHFIYKTSRTTFYPPHPTAAQYSAGGRYFERVYEVEYGHYDINQKFIKESDGTLTVWLEAVLN
ncbi:hypothetical protein [Proteiniphilum propionicum]|uniref:hypothetical protein n=1 Tax=Proteiniphilum propionicum TaxID=2829812 RepID=UPI001EEC284D|nr:hypothetical protein [Proteiniphilum propionicum]ULB33015.1 hypothetical protein KDN43_08095 [Proteiniphilum propionicum]